MNLSLELETICHYILQQFLPDKIISSLFLKNLLALAQIHSVLNSNQFCFPEKIRASCFGYQIPEIYHLFGGCSLLRANQFKPQTKLSPQTKEILDFLIERAKNVSGMRLQNEILCFDLVWKYHYQQWEENQLTIQSIREGLRGKFLDIFDFVPEKERKL